MVNYSFNLYVEKTLGLAETITVKFEDVARAMNLQVIGEYGFGAVDEYDPSSWKYYQNISGTYHFSDKDKDGNPIIQVLSLDTSELIYFTKDNLALHPATKNSYRHGSRYYKELLIQNPGRELLISGIIYPCNIDLAIASKDGTILAYPPELVEFNEYQLIRKLQAWIYDYLDRWVNRQYCMSDNLYVATYVGQFFLHLTQAMFAFRLQACKTNEAHSFHVRQYLASHSNLDVYLADLTPHQALFFYRNINHIQRHAGKRETFDWLVENTFTHKKLPLYEYGIAQDSSIMIYGDGTTERYLVPDVLLKRKPINAPAKENGRAMYALDTVLSLTDNLAKGNPQYRETKEESIRSLLAHAPSASIATKILESQLTDYSTASPYLLDEILLTQWISLVAKKLYTAHVTITLPSTGEVVKLSAKDALIVFVYTVQKASWPVSTNDTKSELVNLPDIHLSRVLKDTPPAKAELVAMATGNYIPSAEIDAILAKVVVPRRVGTNEDFYAYCDEVFSCSRQQALWYSSKERSFSRGFAQKIISRLYADEIVSFKDSNSKTIAYADVLDRLALKLENYTRQMLYDLSSAIFVKATGIEFSSNRDFKRIHATMIRLFTQLSSYSIALTNSASQSEITLVINPAIRLNDQTIKEYQRTHIDSTDIETNRKQAKEFQTTVIWKEDVFPDQVARTRHHCDYAKDLSVGIKQSITAMSMTPQLMFSALSVTSNFDFRSSVKSLSRAQRMVLKDAY